MLNKVAQARAQWHRKDSWRRPAPTPERERAVNWRLFNESSAGLLGEVGIHQIDNVSWFLKALPTAVSGFGGTLVWQDGRCGLLDLVRHFFAAAKQNGDRSHQGELN